MLVNTPPMGWNTWNTFGGKICDSMVRESADAFVELGLKDALTATIRYSKNLVIAIKH